MSVGLRIAAVREHLRGSLWVLPAASVLAALAAGVLLVRVRVDPDTLLGAVLFGGGSDGARGVLEVISGSLITVTTLTFSLTVVALQVAASQFSPRLLRNFLRDRGNQTVLSVFLATFTFSIVVLRTVRSGADGDEEFVPQLAVTVALLLTLSSLAAFVYFIHHLTQSIRVETILDRVTEETLATIDRVCAREDGHEPPTVLSEPPDHAARLVARKPGYVQVIKPKDATEPASDRDVVIRYRHTVGQHVTEGRILAWAWRPGSGIPPEDTRGLEEAVNAAVTLGSERTMQQDVAFGIRQLVDIAIRALSPSLNDPTTAVAALGKLSVVLCGLASRRLGPAVEVGEGGVPRVEVPWPTFGDYLDLACAQIAQYGGADPTVIRALLHVLDDVAGAVDDPPRQGAVSEQIERTLAEADRQLHLDAVKESVHLAAEATLRGISPALLPLQPAPPRAG